MENKCCKNCEHFILHYIKHARGNYAAILFGHCIKPRIKTRKANDKACAYWQEKGRQQK